MQRLLTILRNPRFLFITGLIFAAAASRLLPHPSNFSPIGAMALFAGARFPKLAVAIAVPLLALFLSDLFLPAYEGTWLIYSSFAILVVLGHAVLRNSRSPLLIAGVSVFASLLFFGLTNCVWLYNEMNMYAVSWEGQMTAYIAALPFLWNTIAGDLFYSALLFGSLVFAERKSPVLSGQAAHA